MVSKIVQRARDAYIPRRSGLCYPVTGLPTSITEFKNVENSRADERFLGIVSGRAAGNRAGS